MSVGTVLSKSLGQRQIPMFIDHHRISISMMRALKLSDGCCSRLGLIIIDWRSKQFAGVTEVAVLSDPHAQKPESLASLAYSDKWIQHSAMLRHIFDPEGK